ncbi:MAG: DUF502 domain-containing protein [bacterium]
MWRRLRRNLITGLLVLLPLYLTLVILVKLFLLIDGILNQLATRAIVAALNLPLHEDKIIYGLGVITLILLLFFAGWVARHYIGKQILRWFNKKLDQIPFVNRIYKTLRQISEVFLSDKKIAFQKPILIEYPRRGLYTLVFVTQDTGGAVQNVIHEDCITVFLPSTPNPTTGFVFFVPKSQVIDVDMTSEEALKLIISGGMISPEQQPRTEPENLTTDSSEMDSNHHVDNERK